MSTVPGGSIPLHSVSVAGVVIDERDRVLLIQRQDNGEWQPPGGVLELAETLEEGVCREVFEETGVHVAVERLSGIYQNLSRAVVAVVFRCRAIGGTPQATEESARTAWFPVNDAIARMTEAFAVRVTDAFGNTPAIRAHDGVRIIQQPGP